MYIKTVLLTLAAWFLGLLLDANIDMEPRGFLCLRVLLPVLVMGLCILSRLPQKAATTEQNMAEDSQGS